MIHVFQDWSCHISVSGLLQWLFHSFSITCRDFGPCDVGFRVPGCFAGQKHITLSQYWHTSCGYRGNTGLQPTTSSTKNPWERRCSCGPTRVEPACYKDTFKHKIIPYHIIKIYSNKLLTFLNKCIAYIFFNGASTSNRPLTSIQNSRGGGVVRTRGWTETIEWWRWRLLLVIVIASARFGCHHPPQLYDSIELSLEKSKCNLLYF